MRRRRSPGAALAWALLFVVGAQLALSLAVELGWPGLYDEEFALRLEALRRRRAEGPERPLLLVMGSSRSQANFRPEGLPELRDAAGRRVLPFNFAHLGAGPVMNLMEFQRLRRAGVRPSWLVLEVMPPCLSNEPPSMITECLTAGDLPLLHRYVDRGKLYGRFLRSRLTLGHSRRYDLLRRFAPDWATPEADDEPPPIRLGPLGGDAGWMVKSRVSADEVRRYTERTRDAYRPPLQRFAIQESATRAYRELLGQCRADGVRAALLLNPEGSDFRSWYPPDALRQVEGWCAGLSQEYGVPVIDARRWLPDAAFLDSHHVLRDGAEAFTRRLGEEALRPLVQGRLSSCPTPAEAAGAGARESAYAGHSGP
jgi:hypothetical protein